MPKALFSSLASTCRGRKLYPRSRNRRLRVVETANLALLHALFFSYETIQHEGRLMPSARIL